MKGWETPARCPAYGIWRAVAVDQANQDADQPGRRDRRANLDGQAFSIGFVDHIQRSEPSTAIQGIVYEVQRPAAVWLARHIQRLARPLRQLLLATPRQIQTHITVHPMHTLFVPAAAIKPQPGKALSEPPAPVAADDGVERLDRVGISLGSRHWPLVVRCPRQACNSTATGDRQSGLHQLFNHVALADGVRIFSSERP